MRKQSNKDKHFKNFMSLYLSKPPECSLNWICEVLADTSLSYEAVGILILLGEHLRGSAFSMEQVIKMRPESDPASIVNTLCFLNTANWVSIEIHRENYTANDLRDYFDHISAKS